MTRQNSALAFVAVLSFAAAWSPLRAIAAEKSVVKAAADCKWTSAGIPGVSIAAVEGDMAKGPSHFYLKYDAGVATPMHHHSPDHYVTTISGTLILTADGKEHRLAPGSYFEFTGKAKHAGRVEGNEPCVMFIDARGPWDVVLDTAASAKK